MKRGELYRLRKPGRDDPRSSRIFAIVSRQSVIDSRFTMVICVPVYTARHGLASQVPLGIEDGLKHESALHCDELVSIPKTRLTDFIGALSSARLRELDRALVAALGIDVENLFD